MKKKYKTAQPTRLFFPHDSGLKLSMSEWRLGCVHIHV
jgi:hypothetical protein